MSQTAKDLIFDEEARALLKEGIDQLADVAGVTLGPQGRNIGLQASWGAPKITNDGHSVVGDIELKCQYANMGAAIAKEVASKMKEKCGDGTTTSVLLLRALVQGGVRNIASGFSPIEIKRGMEKGLEKLLIELDALSTPIQNEEELLNIATASSSGQAHLGKIIAQAFKKAGKEGVITIEEGKTTETIIDSVEGMQFDRGYSSSYFCTNAETLTVELEDVKILVTDQKITTIQDLLPILQYIASSAKALLIIADDIETDALSTLVLNRLRGTLKVAAVKAPGFGDRRKAYLQDIATLTGATLISEEIGLTLKEADSLSLGEAEKVLITKDKTTIVGGRGSKETLEAHIQSIEAEIKQCSNKYDLEKLLERKAKLCGGVSVIRVGSATEPAMKQKKQMLEDSLNSSRAALDEGIVPGGGTALLRAARKVVCDNLTKGEKIGLDLLLQACSAPLKQIIENTGLDSSVLVAEIIALASPFGFNALTEKVENLAKAGVVDPTKVIKNAIKLAVSAAATVLLSEVLIGDVEEDK